MCCPPYSPTHLLKLSKTDIFVKVKKRRARERERESMRERWRGSERGGGGERNIDRVGTVS